MGTFIFIIKQVVTLLPLLVQLVRALEEAFPQAGSGSQKLEAAHAILASAYSTADDTGGTFDRMWGFIKPVIDAIVATANVTGEFNTTSK